MGRSRGKKRKEKGSYRGNNNRGEFSIKEKRQEKGEQKGCMERKIHIGNKWWKLMTIQYSKEKKTTEDAIKQNREDRILLGGDFNGAIGEKRARNWEEQRGGREKKIQRQGGKCRGEETDGMDRRKWMGGIEREQTRARRRGMDL
ncbi:hypothetical protein MTP99_002623 [Tenebrio molitor]|jgi:hypothetical protein|nr:hypothetical protein MTP99_002623 [Tenebrio molitor]